MDRGEPAGSTCQILKVKKKKKLTDITGSPARRCHDTRVFHFGQSEIADHDLAVFIRAVVEQILRLDGGFKKEKQKKTHNEFIDGMKDIIDRLLQWEIYRSNMIRAMHAGLNIASSAGFRSQKVGVEVLHHINPARS
jgi:hypothetical protein